MRKTTLLLPALFLVSGACGLIYEVTWTRLLVHVIGSTTFAITTVLVTFMSGLALGGFLAGRVADRLERPARVYGLLAIVVGVYCVLVPVLLMVAGAIYGELYPLTAGNTLLLTLAQFVSSALVLLVPAACIGATLPVLVRYLTMERDEVGAPVALLYGIGAVGAVVGTLLAGFILLPSLGLWSTTFLAGGLNVVVGLLAIFVLRPATPALEEDASAEAMAPSEPDTPPAEDAAPAADAPISEGVRAVIAFLMMASGFTVLIYQIGWTRALIMSIGPSTYVFTSIPAACLVGLAIGSLLIKPFVDGLKSPMLALGLMELGIAASALICLPYFGRLPALVARIVAIHHESYATVLLMELGIVVLLVLLPMLLMGAVFPLGSRLYAHGRHDAGSAAGKIYAFNTVGMIIGSFCAVFLMIPAERIGIQNSLLIAAAINGAIGLLVILLTQSLSGVGRGAFAAICVVVLGLAVGRAPQWNTQNLVRGSFLGIPVEGVPQILMYREGVDATVAVTELGKEHALCVNSKVDGSDDLQDVVTTTLAGHLPCLFADQGKRALVIGLGAGVSLSAVAKHPSYEKLDCVEISQGVIDANRFFAPFVDYVLDDPRTVMIRADGRNHLLLTDTTYDVILSQSSNPWVAGVSNLFTKEFFELCRDRLAPNGRVCVWLQGYHISQEDFRMVIRTLADVFESVTLWEGYFDDYLLVAGKTPFKLPFSELKRRMAIPEVNEHLSRVGLDDPRHLLSHFVTGGEKLRAWVADAPVHTDDKAQLEFSAPKYLYIQETDLIRQAMIDLSVSPFGTVIDPDVPEEELAVMTLAMSNAVESRKAIQRSNLAAANGEVSGLFGNLRRAYDLRPGSYEIFNDILVSLGPIVDALPGTLPSGVLGKAWAELEGIDPPKPAPRAVGMTADKAAQFFIVQGGYWLSENRLDKAEQLMARAAEAVPESWEMHLYYGSVLEAQGKDEQALAQYELAVQHGPMEIAPQLKTAVLLLRKGDAEGASRYFERADQLAPGRLDVLLGLADAKAQQGRLGEAASALESALRLFKELDPARSSVLYQLGRVYEAMNKLDAAIQRYSECVASGAESADVYLRMGQLELSLNRDSDALRHFHRAVALDPKNRVAYIREAQVHRKTGKFDKAAEVLVGAIEKLGTDIRLRLELAGTYAGGGDFAAAVRIYEETLQVDPENSAVLNNYAWILATEESLKDPKRAVELAAKAHQLNPDVVDYVDTLVTALLADNQRQQAIDKLKKTLESLPPGDAGLEQLELRLKEIESAP